MKNKSGNKEGRSNWLETADEEFEQDFFADERSQDQQEEIPAEPETDPGSDSDEDTAEAFDERELEEPPKEKKKWILMGMIILFCVALAMFLFSDRFYNMIQGRSSYTLEKQEQTVSFSEGNISIELDGNRLLRCNQDGLQAFDEKGQVAWDVPFTMSSPYMLKAGDQISVADRLGTRLVLIRNGIVETEIVTEKKILLQCVNEQGSSVVVLDGSDSHDVNLYSVSGELLMQRHTFASEDGIPVAVALNQDGSRMATSYIHYTGTSVQSIVTIFDLTEKGSALVDRIVGSASFEGCLITDLKFSDSGCFFAGTDRFGSLSVGNACEIQWEKVLEYQMDTLILEDTYYAVRYGEGLAGTVSAPQNNIAVYDYSGKLIFEDNIEGITYLDAWGDTLICGAGRAYYGMSSKGSPKWQLDSIEEYSRMIAFENGDTVAALRNGEISFYRVTIKNAMEDENE